MKLSHKTKIIYSLEGQWLNDSVATALAQSTHIDCLRFVYQPKYHDIIQKFIPKLRKLRSPNLHSLSIMIDVGSQSRAWLSEIKRNKEFTYGEKVKIARKPNPDADLIIDGNDLDGLFAKDASVFFGFGLVVLKVLEIDRHHVITTVVQGGNLEAGIEIHVPVTKKMPTTKDLASIDIKSFEEIGVDYVVLPGINSRKELAFVRKKLGAYGKNCPWLMLKIDDFKVFNDLSGLLQEVDGVLISRCDLALTTDAANVPEVCKEISRLCNDQAKLVMIASEMLGSMRFNPTPTRAEVSDIANAVLDGVDAVVLSEEIAAGKHHERAVALCESIVLDVEAHYDEVPLNWQRRDIKITDELECVSFNALKTAQRLAAKAIVCVTKEGNTALRLASFKTTIPIVAVTFSEKTKKRLSLVRGVYAICLDLAPHLDEVLPTVNDRLRQEDWLAPGDKIVFVTVSLSSIGQEASNLFTVQSLT